MEVFGDNLVLIEKLASGGMGEVFLAKLLGKNGFEKTVAVKRIHPRIITDGEMKSLFEHEVQLSARLHHPNIIEAFGNGEIDGYHYLIMEFIDGCTLLQLLSKLRRKQEKLPIDVVMLIMMQVCEGLGYAHDLIDERSRQPLDLIHRDLSPDNVMISFLGVAKIVDFGIVKTTNSLHTQTGILKGKLPYMSPEQVIGQSLDRRSDIFSLFVIMWEAIVGERLFRSKNDLEVLKAVESVDIPSLKEKCPGIDADLEAFLLKGLAKKREDRFQSCHEVLKEIRTYMLKHFPHSDRQILSEFLRAQFTDEIKKRHEEREKIRPEAERFVNSARIQLESRLMSQSRMLSEIPKSDEHSKTKVSMSPSMLYHEAPPHTQSAFKKQPVKVAVAGIGVSLLSVSLVLFLLNRSNSDRSLSSVPTPILKSSAEVPTEGAKGLPPILPDLEHSQHYLYVAELEKSHNKNFLVPSGHGWAYWDKEVPPPPHWIKNNFDDHLWPKGLSPLGYGDPVATSLSYGLDPNNKTPTAYFRAYFEIPNLKALDKFMLIGLRRDDGAIIYINGKRVFSDPFPVDIVTHYTWASRRLNNEETHFVYEAVNKDFFVQGRNYLAAEVHQADPASSDLNFEMLIIGWTKK